MDREEIKGAAERIKGKVRKSIGRATGNRREEGAGAVDETVGKVRQGAGKARRKVKDTLNDVDDAFNRP
jgi:uncharacterized protein YjbJ (UPF0337 family)